MKTTRYFPSEKTFMVWAARNNLRPKTIAAIRRLREQNPSRRPNGRNNVKGFYSSTKMGIAIHFESHTNEFPTIIEFEYDPTVGEYYSQTGQLKLTYPDRSGKTTGCLHTPDLFRITDSGAGWVECKTEEKLRELSQKMPHRYVRADDGSWSCPPAIDAALKLGLTYEIRTRVDQSKRFLVRNLTFLDDYFRRSYPQPDAKTTDIVLTAVSKNQGAPLAELLRQLENKVTPDDLYFFIAQGTIYADLTKYLLIQPHKLLVFSDSEMSQIHEASRLIGPRTNARLQAVHIAPTAKVVINGAVHTIVDADTQIVALRSDDTTERSHYKRVDFERLTAEGSIVGFSPPDATTLEIEQRLAEASTTAKQIAVNRWQIIQPYLSQRRGQKLRRLERTERRWLKNYRKCYEQYGNGFIGLIPKPRSGNTEPKLDTEVYELMMKMITTQLESKKSPSSTHVYGQLRLACEAKGFDCPSLKAFRRCAKSRPIVERVGKTLGPRSAKKLRKFIFFLDTTTAVHGDRPWEVVHIDHTQLDIELVCSETGMNLGRPWFTLMVDAFTRRILAISVSFSNPSTLSCMRIIRDCVRRHNRLPQTIVVDNGKEFESTYFESLLANFSIHKKSRPSGNPRFGSVCERLFGTINSEFILNLIGNTKHMKNARLVTKSFDPKKSAIWTLEQLTVALAEFCFEIYDTTPHPAHTLTPRDAYHKGMLLGGERNHTLIPYNTTFETLTLPTNQSGTAKVHSQKGIHLNYLDYWCDNFVSPRIHGTKVSVLYDPDNISIAYAFVDGKWRECRCRNAYLFLQSSVSSIKAAADELRKRKSNHAKSRKPTARQIAVFMKENAEREDILLERARRDASAAALGVLSGAVDITPPKHKRKSVQNNVAEFPSGNPVEVESVRPPLDVPKDCIVVTED
ncbi:MAG: DDE-type integrase/transposase/recombinase [Opitutaceae bacterium]|nr:DDE-type integrase/transposase/recombinase [Opitutaceae bacterium]